MKKRKILWESLREQQAPGGNLVPTRRNDDGTFQKGDEKEKGFYRGGHEEEEDFVGVVKGADRKWKPGFHFNWTRAYRLCFIHRRSHRHEQVLAVPEPQEARRRIGPAGKARRWIRPRQGRMGRPVRRNRAKGGIDACGMRVYGESAPPRLVELAWSGDP